MGRNIPIKLVVVILLLGIICFFYYRYGLSPQLVQLRDLRDQVTQADTKLSTLQGSSAPARGIREAERVLCGLDQPACTGHARVFDQNEHTRFLLDLQAVGKASGIAYTGIQVSDASMGQGGAAAQPAEVKSCQDRGRHDELHGQGLLRPFDDSRRRSARSSSTSWSPRT